MSSVMLVAQHPTHIQSLQVHSVAPIDRPVLLTSRTTTLTDPQTCSWPASYGFVSQGFLARRMIQALGPVREKETRHSQRTYATYLPLKASKSGLDRSKVRRSSSTCLVRQVSRLTSTYFFFPNRPLTTDVLQY